MTELTPRDPHRLPAVPGPPSQARSGYGHIEDHAEILEEGIELREVLGVLRRRIWLVLAVVVACLGVTLFLISRDEPEYRASAVVRMADAQRALTGGIDPAMMERMGGRQTPDPILSQLELLRSRAVMGATVDREGLRLASLTHGFSVGLLEEVRVAPGAGTDTLEVRFEEGGMEVAGRAGVTRAGYGRPVMLGGVRFTLPHRPEADRVLLAVRHRERAIELLREELRARPREGTDVVEVEYTATHPGLAQRVVNTAMEAFQAHSAELARRDSQRRRIFLEEQLAQTDSMLQESQSILSDFRRREHVFSSREWFAAQQAGLMDLDVRREELDASRRMYRSILAGLQEAQPGDVSDRLQGMLASPEIAANPSILALHEQLVRYEAARDSLVSGPWGAAAGAPDVVRLEEQIGSTLVRLGTAVRSHLESLDARIAAIEQTRARAAAQIEAMPEAEAEETRLVLQVETIRRTVDQLRDEYQRARIAEAVEAGQVEIVDAAIVPFEPVPRRTALMLMLGLVLGLMLGSGAAFLRENLDTAIHRRDELESVLRIPGLVVVPRLPGGNGRVNGRVPRLLERSGLPALRRRSRKETGGVHELTTVSDARSPSAEAFRTLRTNLIFSQAEGELRSLVVTSTAPMEGKTTTVSNLAVAFAQQGLRVLLADCDLRKARLHSVFEVGREPGLTELVLGRRGAGEVVRETAVEGLHLLPSGTLPPNPSELLGGARMRSALADLAEGYDMVLLDTPPLMAGADAAILGAAADGVLLVVRAGSTDREAGQHAVRQLDTVGARVIGAVLNDPDGTVRRYGGYYEYYDSYYGEEEAAGSA